MTLNTTEPIIDLAICSVMLFSSGASCFLELLRISITPLLIGIVRNLDGRFGVKRTKSYKGIGIRDVWDMRWCGISSSMILITFIRGKGGCEEGIQPLLLRDGLNMRLSKICCRLLQTFDILITQAY